MTAKILPFRPAVKPRVLPRFDSANATEEETAAFLADVQTELRLEAERRGMRLRPFLSLAS